MKASQDRIVLMGLLSVGLFACDSSTEPTGSVTPPVHPAMEGSVGRKSLGVPHSGRPSGELPPDHPPIQPGARTSIPGGASSSGTTGGVSSARAAGGAVEAPPGTLGVERRLAAAGLVCKLPQGWLEEPPSNSMRLGQARLSRVATDAEDGEISISQAVGSVEANVNRWSEQFVEKPTPTLTDRKVGDIKIVLVEMEGTFTSGGPMMKAVGGPKPGTKLIGLIVIVPGSQQTFFFKAWGPKVTMEHWKPSFDELVSSFGKA